MAETSEPMSMDRRSLIRKSAIVAGTAWVAPMVLTSRAGAQTQICYWVKADFPGTSLTDLNGDDQCAPKPSGTVPGGSGSATWSSLDDDGEPRAVTVTVAAGCQIKQVVLKRGQECSLFGGNNSNSQTVSVPGSPAISHVTVHYCCDAASN